MMILNKDWRIVTDRYNVILQKRAISKKSGKEYWLADGYYPTYKAALRACVEKSIKGIDDLELIVEKIEELYTMIENLKGVK